MHYYKILKHNAGFDEGTSYWEKLLTRYLAATGGGKIHTTLPITFTSTSWKLVSWTIYGNNYEHKYSTSGTLPLTFTTHTAGNADDWSISGNDEVGENLVENIEQGSWSVTGFVKSDATTRCRIGNIIDVVGSQQYTMYLECPSHTGLLNIQFKNDAGTSKGETGWQSVGEGGSYTMTAPSDATKITIILTIDAGGVNCTPANFTNVMFVKGSTAPDHYIPYQQGVGERTENKMPPPVNGVYSANRTTVTVTDGVYHIVRTEGSGSSSVYIGLPEFEVPDSGYINYLNSMSFSNTTVVLRYNGVSLSGGYSLTPINRAVAIGSDYAGKKVNQIQIYTTGEGTVDFTIAPMITGSNTYTEYIPYGYQIPIAVSQTGQPDKNYNIYIGDSPLTEGETVSKTSTGVDIAAIAGTNTISTDLYNKPSMSITGVDYVGVGERTVNLVEAKIANTNINANGQIISNPDFNTWVAPIEQGVTYTFTSDTATYAEYTEYPVLGLVAYNNTRVIAATTFTATIDGYIAFRTSPNYATAMCVIGSTAPETYIPFGYQIPLTVSQTGQTDKTVDIFIGDSPLTEGQSVSNTTEIEVFEGENTIDTTLYNKPEMEIVYE